LVFISHFYHESLRGDFFLKHSVYVKCLGWVLPIQLCGSDWR